MTKILISAYACNPSLGSESSNGWEWAKGIASRGYEVHLLTTSRGQKDIDKNILNYNIIVHYIDHSKFWSKAYYWNFIFMYIAYWLWQKKIYKYAKNKFKKNEIDFVHHVTWGSLKIASNLYKLNIPMLFGPVGGGQLTPLNFKEHLGDDYKKEKMRNFLGIFILKYNPFSRNILKKAQILVTNEDTFKLVSEMSTKKPKLVFDAGIKEKIEEKNYETRDQKKLNLVWVGRAFGFKGLRLIIHALSLIDKETLKNIHLDIVGNGRDMKNVIQIVKDNKLTDNVNFIGFIPYEKVKEYLSKNNCFIYTSLRDSFPSQILEAQIHKLPVITLNLHGQALMVNTETGIKCSVAKPEKTITEIKEAILYLLNNPDKRIELGNEAYKQATNHTWDKKIDAIVHEFYPKLPI